MTTRKEMAIFKQGGAVTILISLVMLFLVTLVVLTTSKTVLMEQKITSNQLRSEQSFEAAETGLQEALNFLSGSPDWDAITALATGDALNIFDINSDGTLDSNAGPSPIPSGSGTYTLTMGAGGDLTGEPKSIEIVSTGTSDDGVASRVVTRLIKFIDPIPFPLDNPLLSGAGATVMGSANVWNPQGNSTIWSGGVVNVGSNTHIADSFDATYPTCLDTPMTCPVISSSTASLTGFDVIEQDSSLAALSSDSDAFFQNFFGLSVAEFKNSMVTLEVDKDDIENQWDDANPGISNSQHEVIWVNSDTTNQAAKIAGGTTSGCETDTTENDAYGNAVCLDGDSDGDGDVDEDINERKPSIIIVEGDLHIVGNMDHYGVLYVTGEIFATGSAKVEGSLVIAGGSGNTGSMDVWFNSDMVEGAGEGNNWGGSDGGWRDF